MVLLHLLRWLRANTNWRLEVLLLRDGKLEADFARAAHVVHRSKTLTAAQHLFALRSTISGENIGGLASRLTMLKRARPLLFCVEEIVAHFASRDRISRARYDLIYANTVGAGGVLRVLAKSSTPILTHVHELEYAFSRLAASSRETLNRSAHFVACSRAVAQNLTENHDISSACIDVVHEFVETRREVNIPVLQKQMRERLQLPPDAFVVMCGGALEWRKGVDWWLQTARLVQAKYDERTCDDTHKKKKREIRFVWIGAASDPLYELQLRHDLQRMNLENIAVFTGALPDARDAFAAGDLFFLPSREDPFPLVCLEAAALGLPITCFENAGGMSELVGNDAGFLVPYGDCDTAAQHIFSLINDEKTQRKLGARAAEKARDFYDVSVGAPQIMNIIARVLVTDFKL